MFYTKLTLAVTVCGVVCVAGPAAGDDLSYLDKAFLCAQVGEAARTSALHKLTRPSGCLHHFISAGGAPKLCHGATVHIATQGKKKVKVVQDSGTTAGKGCYACAARKDADACELSAERSVRLEFSGAMEFSMFEGSVAGTLWVGTNVGYVGKIHSADVSPNDPIETEASHNLIHKTAAMALSSGTVSGGKLSASASANVKSWFGRLGKWLNGPAKVTTKGRLDRKCRYDVKGDSFAAVTNYTCRKTTDEAFVFGQRPLVSKLAFASVEYDALANGPSGKKSSPQKAPTPKATVPPKK